MFDLNPCTWPNLEYACLGLNSYCHILCSYLCVVCLYVHMCVCICALLCFYNIILKYISHTPPHEFLPTVLFQGMVRRVWNMHWPNDVYLAISKIPESSQWVLLAQQMHWICHPIQEIDKIADLLYLVVIHFSNAYIDKYATGYLECNFTVYSRF